MLKWKATLCFLNFFYEKFRKKTLENAEALEYNKPKVICCTMGELVLIDASCVRITNI